MGDDERSDAVTEQEAQSDGSNYTNVEVNVGSWYESEDPGTNESDDQDFLGALSVAPSIKNNDKTEEARFRKIMLKKNSGSIMRPQVNQRDKQCLATVVTVNGMGAWALWDSGSTTTGLTPTFAQIAKSRYPN